MRSSGFLAILAMTSAAIAAPTYNQDIAPILYQNCATCHRPGEVAPFSLLTYTDAAKRAGLIAQATAKRYMPPWKPEPGYGDFAHERRLTDAQIGLLRDWAAAGAPEGDGPQPPAPLFAKGWQGGEPDRIVKMPSSFNIPADGPDQFQCFVLPTGLDKDVFVGAMEFRPGNPRVVHHALVFMDTSGQARKLAEANGGDSYPCFGGARVGISGLLFGWAPGSPALPAEAGLSRVIPKGTDIVVQLHYHPSGKPETDQSQLGLTFAPAPTKGVALAPMVNTGIYIPAGDPDYRVKSTMTIPQDADLVALAPHAHYLGKEMKIDAKLPDGSITHLLWIKDWDFNWQGQYRFKQAIHLPKGTQIEMEYSYDNSSANPRNPSNPPKEVHWGEQTTDEMAVAFLALVLPKPEDVPAFQRAVQRQVLEMFISNIRDVNHLPEEIPPALAKQLQAAIQIFDANHDGKLDDNERKALQQAVSLLLPR
ncbi:MAG: ascorbate-dependent monooxygenase [Acidobacteriota bacterium]